MRNKVAKRIRKQFYGDMSFRNRAYATLNNGQVITTDFTYKASLRRQYRRAKKAWTEQS